MRQLFDQVRTFMRAAGQQWAHIPEFPSVETIDLGLRLIHEEWDELGDAVADVPIAPMEVTPEEKQQILANVADALGDLLYVVTWNALAWGLPMPEIMEEIQRANMAKFGPGSFKDEHGKVQKPPGWQPPDIKQFTVPREMRPRMPEVIKTPCATSSLKDRILGFVAKNEGSQTPDLVRGLGISPKEACNIVRECLASGDLIHKPYHWRSDPDHPYSALAVPTREDCVHGHSTTVEKKERIDRGTESQAFQACDRKHDSPPCQDPDCWTKEEING